MALCKQDPRGCTPPFNYLPILAVVELLRLRRTYMQTDHMILLVLLTSHKVIYFWIDR